MYTNTVITGSGSYIPDQKIKNSDFRNHTFYNEKHQILDLPCEIIEKKFHDITGIRERRYANDDLKASDIAAKAAEKAIKDAGIDPETIDQIILAHNFGDINKNSIQTDILPGLAARVKHILQIKNPACIAFDILFGCPGWIQGVINAHAFIKAGIAKRFLVIGAETLSRVVDKYDRDSMIYADGAGAVIIEAKESNTKMGVLSFAMQTHTKDEAYYLFYGKSNNPSSDQNVKYIKMHGRKIYEFALKNVPQAMKIAVDESNININDIKKILIHQANEKMDEAIVKRFYRLYKQNTIPKKVMPMSIRTFGNSSVASIPTLFDIMKKGEFENHYINKNDILLFASVGAGMHINSFVYKY